MKLNTPHARRNGINIGGLHAKRAGIGVQGALPRENFTRPRPLDSWKTLLLYKLLYSNDEQMTMYRYPIDED